MIRSKHKFVKLSFINPCLHEGSMFADSIWYTICKHGSHPKTVEPMICYHIMDDHISQYKSRPEFGKLVQVPQQSKTF